MSIIHKSSLISSLFIGITFVFISSVSADMNSNNIKSSREFTNDSKGRETISEIYIAGNYTILGDIDGFAQWTHIVGTGNGNILFYNQSTGKGAISQIN